MVMSGEVLDTDIVYDTYELLRDLASVTRRAGDEDKSPVARTVMENHNRIEELAGVLREAWLNGLHADGRAPAEPPVCTFCQEAIEEEEEADPTAEEQAEAARLAARLDEIRAGRW
jgi:hypothetical protein